MIMCMLTYIPAGIQPDIAKLSNGAEINNDGHGFALVSGAGRLVIRHSMDAAGLLDEFEWMRSRDDDGPALFHSRYSTGGKIDESNCHPFYVGRDPLTVVAHNGVMPANGQPPKGDVRSDTRYTAEELLTDDPFNINSRSGRKRLAKWIGSFNKLVFLTVNPRFRRNGYIINEAAGTWRDGSWYSNRDFEATWNRHQWFVNDCPFCPGSLVDKWTGECASCGKCVDCGYDWQECQCYFHDGKWVVGSEPTEDSGPELSAAEVETIEQWWARQQLADAAAEAGEEWA